MNNLNKFKTDTKIEIRKNEFIQKATKLYNGNYDYSNVEYINAITPVEIKCNKHNLLFYTSPHKHLKHSGCSKCRNEKLVYGKDRFLEQAKKIHGDTYDYSKVDYVSNNIHVIIICKKHGEFRQKPSHHLHGQNCIKCVIENQTKHDRNNLKVLDKTVIENTIAKLKAKYPNLTFKDFVHSDRPITCLCPTHGVFYKTPHSMLRPGDNGCKLCNNNSIERREAFIKKAKLKHGDKFDYSKLDMNDKKPIIICKKHGEFRQKRENHLLYQAGCPECRKDNISMSKEEFIKRAKKKFGNKYDYSKVNYVNLLTPVEIICKEHGSFMKLPSEHIRLHKNYVYNYSNGGCQLCNKRSPYEKKAVEHLQKLNIDFKIEFKLPNYDFRWDICIPEVKLLIEIDDDNHYMANVKEIDKLKNILASSCGYKIKRISVLRSDEKEHFIDNLNFILKTFIKYRCDNHLFSNFLQLCKYLKLPGYVTPQDVVKYKFNPNAIT